MEIHCRVRILSMDNQVMVLDRIVYSEERPHPKWQEDWYSKSNKYPPITDFNDFECIEEITDWGDIECNVPSHTYVLNRAGHCCGYFIRNDLSNWVEFGRPSTQFSKSRRKFKKVKIGYIPISLESL